MIRIVLDFMLVVCCVSVIGIAVVIMSDYTKDK